MQVNLTDAEWRAVQLMRAVQYGVLLVRMKAGVPVQTSIELEVHLDKPEWPGLRQLLQLDVHNN